MNSCQLRFGKRFLSRGYIKLLRFKFGDYIIIRRLAKRISGLDICSEFYEIGDYFKALVIISVYSVNYSV